jgi:hypothetical protein
MYQRRRNSIIIGGSFIMADTDMHQATELIADVPY